MLILSISGKYWRITIVLLLALGTVPSAIANSFVVSSLNLNRLYDDADNGSNEPVLSHSDYRKRLSVIAATIATELSTPDILALQEAENLSTVRDLAELIEQNTNIQYQAILREGNDVSGIDVAFLVKSDWVIREAAALFQNAKITDSTLPLFSRPPLYVEVCKQPVCLSIVNLHLRSMRGLRKAKGKNRVGLKRRQQAQHLASWSERFQVTHPNKQLIVAGDFNALYPPDRFTDIVGTLLGTPDQQTLYPSKDLITRDLIRADWQVPDNERVTYYFRNRAQQLDYILITQNLLPALEGMVFHRLNRKLSDHAPISARFEWINAVRAETNSERP